MNLRLVVAPIFTDYFAKFIASSSLSSPQNNSLPTVNDGAPNMPNFSASRVLVLYSSETVLEKEVLNNSS